MVSPFVLAVLCRWIAAQRPRRVSFVTALAPTRPIGLFWHYTLNAGTVNEAIGLARDPGGALLVPGELQSEFAGGSPRTALNSFATD